MQFNGIPPASILRAPVENKTNTLDLIGPTNTDKTLFIKFG